jgi:hypothetical protein
MQVDFASSAGFANLQLNDRANTSIMPEDQAEELEGLVEGSGVFDLEQDEVNPSVTVGRADVISDRLTVSDDNRQTTLWLNDLAAPTSIRPLLAYLQKLALEQKRTGSTGNK